MKNRFCFELLPLVFNRYLCYTVQSNHQWNQVPRLNQHARARNCPVCSFFQLLACVLRSIDLNWNYQAWNWSVVGVVLCASLASDFFHLFQFRYSSFFSQHDFCLRLLKISMLLSLYLRRILKTTNYIEWTAGWGAYERNFET